MFGNLRPLTPVRTARSMLAGAALLAAAGTARADDLALAIPRITVPGDGGAEVSLPQPLAPSDAIRVRRILDMQRAGRLAAAKAETASLGDTLLLGHILADRYLLDQRRVTQDELVSWLARFPGQPDTPAIVALLRGRAAKATPLPDLPTLIILPPEGAATATPEEVDPAAASLARNPLLDRTIAERLRLGATASALTLIAKTPGLSPLYGGALQAEVARTLFLNGHDADAYGVAKLALARSHGGAGDAGLVGGLAAWRLDRPDAAAPMFTAAFHAALATPALRTEAAFWAARAFLRAGDTASYLPWMRRATADQHTFYGLLARRTLGIGTRFDHEGLTLSEADIAAVDATPEGHRAFALLQVGETVMAEAELRVLWPKATQDPALQRATLLVATAAGLSGLSTQLADLVQAADGHADDDLRFPVPKLHPRGGFRVDPAMVYAMTRIESNFDPSAISPAGARGLMQVMPLTAGLLAGSAAYAPAYAQRLRDPGVNLQAGQLYLNYLAQLDFVRGDLIRMLASYNAGPGNAAKWMGQINHQDDPLMFIESIPLDETRDYVKRALTYTWIYAARLGLQAVSLDELAAGAWPRFEPLAEARDTVLPVRTVAVRLH